MTSFQVEQAAAEAKIGLSLLNVSALQRLDYQFCGMEEIATTIPLSVRPTTSSSTATATAAAAAAQREIGSTCI